MKFSITTVFIAIVLFTSCRSNQTPDKTGSEKKVLKRDQQEGVADISDEIIANPNDPNLYLKRALAYKRQNLFDLAIRDVERAIAIDPTVSYFYATLGEVYFSGGDLKSARINLEKSVAYDPENTDALLKLGEVNFLLRRYDEGLTAINDALRVNDKLAQGYFIKGYIYKELGDTASAVSSLQTATEVNPEHFEAYMELGNILAYQGDPLALEYFETAIELNPNSAQALYNKGMYLQAGSQFDEAVEVYRSLINIDSDNFLGYYNTGYIFLTEYLSFDTAMAYFDTVLLIDPTYIDAYYNKGLCFEELKEKEKAIDIYRSVLDTDPQYTLAAMGMERLTD